MRRLSLLIILISLSTVFAMTAPYEAQSAGGQCTVQDRLQLHQAGYTMVEVEDMCARQSSNVLPSSPWGILAGEGQNRWVQWCVTPQGRCWLNPATSYGYAVGAPCNCSMLWGSYGGVAE
jgi:hypothetical protein